MPKIANIQLNSQDNIDNNLAIIKQAVSVAKDNGADLAVLPENACVMGRKKSLPAVLMKWWLFMHVLPVIPTFIS